MDETKSGIGWAGLLIIFVVIWLLFGGAIGGRNNAIANDGYNGGCSRVSNCEIEKETIIRGYENNLNIINQGILTRTQAQENTNRLFDQAAGQYNAGKDEKIFDLKLANIELQNKLYMNEKFCQTDAQLADIRCNMLTKPQLSGIASTCQGQIIPRINDCGCGCGNGNF